ncbi:MAG: hypothetical protein AAF907_10695, partial [Planctomycetota bacterium]
MTESSRRRSMWLFVAGAGGLLAAAVVLLLWPKVEALPGPDRAAELVVKHNAAVAALEAGDPQSAEPLLTALAEETLPEELGVRAAALRNRAVGAVLAIDPESGHSVPKTERDRWFPVAEEAVAALQAAAPDDPAAYWLQSRIAASRSLPDEERAALRRAARASRGEIWPIAALAVALGNGSEDADRREAAKRWGEAAEFAPENVWVQLQAAKAETETEEPTATRRFAALRTRLEPYGNGFALRQNGDILPLIEAGQTAAKANDWPAARRAATLLFNVLRSEEIVRSDRTAVQRTALDFLSLDFPPEFYASTGLSRTPDPTAIEVRYRPFTGLRAPPDRTGIRYVAMANFDLLGREELICL